MYNRDLNLDDLLADPLVRMVMASDGVDEDQIRTLAHRIAPRGSAASARRAQLSDVGASLRHTPSCRAAWGHSASAQQSV